MYSISDKQENITLNLPNIVKNVYLSDLKETRVNNILMEDHRIEMVIKPAQIVTFEVEF